MEGERGDDGSLGRGVQTVDVGGRVRLGVAQLLGRGQGLVEAEPLGAHLVQDVVGGAVDDAEDAGDQVAGHGLTQCVDHGDGSGYGRLVVEVDLRRRGRRVELGTVGGDQGLVPRDDGGPGPEGRQDERAGRLDATDQLDDQVVGGGHARRVIGQQLTRDRLVAWRARVPHGYARHLQPGSRAGGELLGLLQQEADHLGAHRAATEHSHAQGGGSCRRGRGGWERGVSHGSYQSCQSGPRRRTPSPQVGPAVVHNGTSIGGAGSALGTVSPPP